MLFEVKKYSFPYRSLNQTASLSSLKEAVEHKVFHSQSIKRIKTTCFYRLGEPVTVT